MSLPFILGFYSLVHSVMEILLSEGVEGKRDDGIFEMLSPFYYSFAGRVNVCDSNVTQLLMMQHKF